MFRRLKAFDDWLIEEVFEPLAQHIYNATGKDVFWSSLVFANVYLLLCALQSLIDTPEDLLSKLWMPFVVWVMMTGSAGMHKLKFRVKPGMANPLREYLRFARFFFLLCLPVILAVYLNESLMAGAFIPLSALLLGAQASLMTSIYLLATSLRPRPPRKQVSVFAQPAPAAWRG
jgi:hypothetical protein